MLASPAAIPIVEQEPERQPELPPHRQLPTPPMRNAPLPSSMKLRLRSHTTASSTTADAGPSRPPQLQLSRKRVRKVTPAPRGPNKRRREDEDVDDEDMEEDHHEEKEDDKGPSTPKRVRVVPEILPLGLDRRDFELLHESHQYSSENALGINTNPPGSIQREPNSVKMPSKGEQENGELDDMGIDWSNEEDRVLVEMVLQKLKLTKNDWHDCARTLGRDSAVIGRRWKSLLGNGEVGLKGRTGRIERRGVSATWR